MKIFWKNANKYLTIFTIIHVGTICTPCFAKLQQKSVEINLHQDDLSQNPLESDDDYVDEEYIPQFVYRATVTAPQVIFQSGFERGGGRRVQQTRDLSEHMYAGLMSPIDNLLEVPSAQRQNPSAFVSTYEHRDYAINLMRDLMSPFLDHGSIWANRLYVYQIVPQHDFISVVDSYQHALNDPLLTQEQRQNLISLDRFYTEGNEFAVLDRIPREIIVSAARYEFDFVENRYVERESQYNVNFARRPRTDHLRIYPIGNVPNAQEVNSINRRVQCELEILPSSQANFMRRKRETQSNKQECIVSKSQDSERILLPKELFVQNSIKIKVKNYNANNYCLTTYKDYVYLESCTNTNVKNDWIYTELGQLISEIHDGKNDQYYCLTSIDSNKNEYRLRMRICDLNSKDQVWKFAKTLDGYHALVSLNGKIVGAEKSFGNYYYATLTQNKLQNTRDFPSILATNFEEIKEKISRPLIQFSIGATILNKSAAVGRKIKSSENPVTNYTLYPSYNGYVYSFDQKNSEDYVNYFNLHNKTLFSNYGYTELGPNVCYVSNLVKKGGSSWNWARNAYCSLQGDVANEFKWDLKKWDSNDGDYKIVDKGNNILRSNNLGYALYLGNLDWTDSSTLYQYFSFNLDAKSYANYLYLTEKYQSEVMLNNPNGINKTMYDIMKQYFMRKLFKNNTEM